MHRFYVDEGGITEGRARLTPEDARHALRVLRLGPGDPCELFCGGGRYRGVILEGEGDSVTVRVEAPLPSTEPALRVTLYQGLPKADKMELIVQKAVELGVHAIVPVAMSRCVTKLDSRDAERKRERWQKIAHEACKQSGRCAEPQIALPLPIRLLPERLRAHEVALVPWEEARACGLARVRETHPEVRDMALVIGPEGGMSGEEVGRMAEAGAVPVTLGPRILRTETAGLAALSGLMCLWGEWENIPTGEHHP